MSAQTMIALEAARERRKSNEPKRHIVKPLLGTSQKRSRSGGTPSDAAGTSTLRTPPGTCNIPNSTGTKLLPVHTRCTTMVLSAAQSGCNSLTPVPTIARLREHGGKYFHVKGWDRDTRTVTHSEPVLPDEADLQYGGNFTLDANLHDYERLYVLTGDLSQTNPLYYFLNFESGIGNISHV